MASPANATWNCPVCTFSQSALNDECQMCGEKNKSVAKIPQNNNNYDNNNNNNNNNNKNKNNNDHQYGSIIYQVDRFSDDQLTATYTLYVQNPDIKTSNWPLYLFGDNDIDNSRPPNTDREMIGGLAGVAGKYDQNIAFGIITTFYAYKPMPDFPKFKGIMNNQFDELWNKYILNGHSLIIPSPNTNDLKQHQKSFYEQINSDDDNPEYEQIIFHNIGTGIARLPLLYLKYIQYKMDNIAQLSAQYNEGKEQQLPFKKMKIMEIEAPQKQIERKEDDNINDDDDKKQKEIDFYANDVIEVCVNPDIDVWVEAVFIGYKDKNNKNQCFLEIMNKGKENKFLEMNTKYIRFKNNDFDEKNDDEKKMEIDNNGSMNNMKNKLIKSDEWENVTDFVLKEYIRDVFDELSSDLLNSLDEFMRRMEFLGVYSAKSRSRALTILEEMKNNRLSLKLAEELEANEKKENEQYKMKIDKESDEFIAAEIAQKLADGHTLEPFKCIRCNLQQEFGGIELTNCSHKICYKCFPQLITSHITMKMMPSCLQCGSVIHQTDIKVHVNAHTAEIVSDIQIKDMMSKQKDLHRCFAANCDGCIIIEDKYMKEWRCPVCDKRNCIKCKQIHLGNEQCYVPPPPKPIRPKPYKYNKYNNKYNSYNTGNYHITNEEFINNWVNMMDIKSSNMVQSFDVPFQSDEWNKVILYIRDPNKRKVERIQRIQNAKVWRAYWAYCNKMKKKREYNCKIGGFWHGTRTHKPSVIWKFDGFLKNKSRIGNCLWFATENTYSMGGFQHVASNGKHKVFLAFVCCGNTKEVKFIRNNQILNVYKDAATYPAYLLTYKNV